MKTNYKSEGFEAEIKEVTLYNAAKSCEETWAEIKWIETPDYINAEELRTLFASRASAVRYFRIMSGV